MWRRWAQNRPLSNSLSQEKCGIRPAAWHVANFHVGDAWVKGWLECTTVSQEKSAHNPVMTCTDMWMAGLAEKPQDCQLSQQARLPTQRRLLPHLNKVGL